MFQSTTSLNSIHPPADVAQRSTQLAVAHPLVSPQAAAHTNQTLYTQHSKMAWAQYTWMIGACASCLLQADQGDWLGGGVEVDDGAHHNSSQPACVLRGGVCLVGGVGQPSVGWW